MLIRTRRDFFKLSLRSAATIAAANQLGMVNALAQGPDYKALVCVFLFGGNDSNNNIIPLGPAYAQYQGVRQALALPSANLLTVNTPQGAYGLHPNLAELHALFNQSRAAALVNVGMLVRPTTRAQYLGGGNPVPANLFSHSDQQQQWQSGVPTGNSTTGWGGRIADRLAAMNPPTFPTSLGINGGSLLLVGQDTQPGTIDPATNGQLEGSDGSDAANARNAAIQQVLNFQSGFSLIQAANFSLREGMRIGDILAGISAAPLNTAFPTTGLGQQLQQVARVIQARNELGMRRQIFFCSMGGYDTHSNQLGAHVGLLTELSQAIGAFYNATVELGVAGNVTTFTESEFNRTFQPNANAGTDHAWGGHQFVVGGAVQGNQVYGTFPQLALQGPDDSGNRGNWIPTTSLDQYGATLAKWFGVQDIDLPLVFPNLNNFTTKTLGFV